MPLEPGTTLGPYQIDAPLGAGGMGEVYKATDTRLDRTVAIKVLPEHVASDPDLKQRFEREARTVAALNHPHICHLYDIGSQDGIDFLVLRGERSKESHDVRHFSSPISPGRHRSRYRRYRSPLVSIARSSRAVAH